MKILTDIVLIFVILALIAFIITLIYFIISINKYTTIKDKPINLFIKDLYGDNIINTEEIEQITQIYNNKEKQYEIIFYLKSGHELKEKFINDYTCKERFNDIYNIINDYTCEERFDDIYDTYDN